MTGAAQGGKGMEHWERLCEGGLKFVYGDGAFPPSTDSFLLSSLPRLKKGCRVCDLGCGTGLLGILLSQRQRQITVTGVELHEEAAALLIRRGGLPAQREAPVPGDQRVADAGDAHVLVRQ